MRQPERWLGRCQRYASVCLIALFFITQPCSTGVHAQTQSSTSASANTPGPSPGPSPPPLPTLPVSSACASQLLAPITSPGSAAASDALHRIDASGHVPAALAYDGSFVSFGSYEECLHIGKKAAQYCRAYAVVLPDIAQTQSLAPLTGWLGLCLPAAKSCTDDDVAAIFSMVSEYGSIGLSAISSWQQQSAMPIFTTVNGTIECTDGSRKPFTLGACLVLGLCVIVLLTAIAATIMDQLAFFFEQRGDGRSYHSPQYRFPKDGIDMYIDTPLLPPATPTRLERKREKSPNPLGAFSLSRNIPQLFSLKSSPGVVESLDGIRFFSLTWVILGHTYLWVTVTQATGNHVDISKFLGRLTAQPVANGYLSVDSFFFLSGFLLALGFQRTVDKSTSPDSSSSSRPPNAFYIISMRLIRLLPLYMLVLLVFWQLEHWMILPGPLSSTVKSPDAFCEKSWWTNILFINNFYPHDGNISKMCLGWSWYLAVDMQLFIISLLPLTFLAHKDKGMKMAGYVIVCACIATSVIVPIALTYHYNLPANASVGEEAATAASNLAKNAKLYSEEIYVKPYSRAGPYFIGILIGYLFAKKTLADPPVQVENMHAMAKFAIGAVMWICTGAVMILCTYGFYGPNHHPDHQWSKLARAAYNGLARPGWGLALAWVVIACEWKWAGVIGSFLSAPAWKPLSKLTYGAYLVHPIILNIYFLSQRTAFYMNDITMISIYVSVLFFSYAIAAVLYLTLERPAAVLTRPPKKE